MDLSELDRKILGDVWSSSSLWDSMVYLCDECNGRFAGTEDERRAGDYLVKRFKEIGCENVAAESFKMEGWERGEAKLVLVENHMELSLPCLSLACSPAGQAEAEIIDVGKGTHDDFERLGSAIAGKIIFTTTEGPHRSNKYVEAQNKGAVGFLFANTQPGMSIPAGSVHMGGVVMNIPAISMAAETGHRIQRKLQNGSVRIRMSVKGGNHTVTARNIVAELPGTNPGSGWIVVGGHYDGHDVAQGAQDNATGTAMVLESARLLSPFRSRFKAGLRFVLFSGEELGLNGSFAYVHDHPNDLDKIRAVFNADIVGMAQPLVMMTQNSPELAAYLQKLPLKELDAVVNDTTFIPHSDHFPFSLKGISTLMAVTSHPSMGFGWAHSPADTLDKVEIRSLRAAAATTARILLRVAMQPKELPRKRKTPKQVEEAINKAGFAESMRQQGILPLKA